MAHRERRELGLAVGGAVLAGALALVSGAQAWATVTADRRSPLPPVQAVVSGSDVAPLVPAAGLVLLAAAVALLAVRGVGRLVVGLLVAVAGGALAWSAVRALAGAVDRAARELPGLDRVTSSEVAVGWPVLCLVASLVAVAAGLLVVLRGRSWPGMGRKYERSAVANAPSSAAMSDDERAQAAWKALDRGEDPTA